MAITRTDVERHLADGLRAAAGWQQAASALAPRHAGGLACPVARTTMQWAEFFFLPIATAHAEIGFPAPEAACIASGLVDFLARVQRPDGSFDAGFCGDLYNPCNAAFALRPLSDALAAWPASFPAAGRATLRRVVERAASACVEGGMNTPNHRWVAAGGLAHASRALGDATLLEAALAWTRTGIDVDEDGAFSEGSPNYALVSCDMLLDLEALGGRTDLGDLARRSLRYLRAVAMPGGGFATVASSRYDTEGSTDTYARAASVLGRIGAPEMAQAALQKLFATRLAPGVLAPHVFPPAGRDAKAKLYPSVGTAIAAENLLRWLRAGAAGAAPETAEAAGESDFLRASGILRHRAGAFALAAGRGPNLLELHAGGAVIEATRLLVHQFGWNVLFAEEQRRTDDGFALMLTSAPGSQEIRLPQFLLAAPDERRLGTPIPVTRAKLALRCGPGPRARLEIDATGPEGANALLEIGARPDQRLASASGAPLPLPYAPPPSGRLVLRGSGPELLEIAHEGGSGHAVQVDFYGYGAGDALYAPSFHPGAIRFGFELPGRLVLELRMR